MNLTLNEYRERESNRVLNHFEPNNPNVHTITYIQALMTSVSFGMDKNLSYAISQTDIDNKTGIDLENEGEKYNVIRQQPSQSIGNIVINVTDLSSTINANDIFLYNGLKYQATSGKTAQAITFGNSNKQYTISKIETFASTKKAIVHCENHGLSQNIIITGQNLNYGLDGEQIIATVEDDLFTFTNDNITQDTVITTFADSSYFSANVIIVEIISQDTGSYTNIARGSEVVFAVTPDSAIMKSSGFVDYNEIGGGSDLEGDTDYRARIKARKKTLGSVATIETIVRNVSGVTEAVVIEKIYGVGTYGVCFLRQNDTNPIPTAQEIEKVRQALTSSENRSPSDVDNIYVEAPIQIKRKIKITGLSPNTGAMQSAVKAKIIATALEFGIKTQNKTNINTDSLKTSIIQNTYDSATNRIQQITSLEVFDENDDPSTLDLAIKEYLSIDSSDITFV